MNNLAQVELLLIHKADPNMSNSEGISPLHIAVLKGNINIIKVLLDNKANPNLPSRSFNQTPLHFAYQQNVGEDIINLLLKYEASNLFIDKSNKKPSDYVIIPDSDNNNTNTYRENTFTLENQLDCFTSVNKESSSKKSNKEIIDTVPSNNLNIPPFEIKITNDLQSKVNSITIVTPTKEQCLEDSLEEDEDKSKAYYVSDFPLSSMKKENKEKNQDEETIYKKIIIAKRLNLSSHSKNDTCVYSNKQHRLNTNPNNKLASFLNSTCNENTDLDINPYSTMIKHNNFNNMYSNYSTQPQTSKFINSLNKKAQSQVYDTVSEFTIQKVLPSEHHSTMSKEDTDRIKTWLSNINLYQYSNLFISNNLDMNTMIGLMSSNETKIKYDDLEMLGIKKPGHIYRILTKLDIDIGKIDRTIIEFILPYNKIVNSIDGLSINNLNLKISNEYCCGCIHPSKTDVKNDIKSFLQRNNLLQLYPNFYHNGFDSIEFILLQMYSSSPITSETLEDCFHIYEEEERIKILDAIKEEIQKINLFVNSTEYINNKKEYHYINMQLERDEFKGLNMVTGNKSKCNSTQCIIF